MNISVFSIHFVNYLAIKHISYSFPPVQIILLLHFERLSLQTAAAAAAQDQRLYFVSGSLGLALQGRSRGGLLDAFILHADFLASAAWVMIPVTQVLAALMCFCKPKLGICTSSSLKKKCVFWGEKSTPASLQEITPYSHGQKQWQPSFANSQNIKDLKKFN